MFLQILFWLLMILSAILGFCTYRTPDQAWLRGSWGFVVFILLAILGWAVFGAPK